MTVRVRLFAMLRERAGRDVVELDLPDGASVGDALAALEDVTGGVTCVMAVNRDYADPARVLTQLEHHRDQGADGDHDPDNENQIDHDAAPRTTQVARQTHPR